MGHETIAADKCCCGCVFINHDPAGCTTCKWCRGFHRPDVDARLHRAMDIDKAMNISGAWETRSVSDHNRSKRP